MSQTDSQSKWHLLLESLFEAISLVCKVGWEKRDSALTPFMPRPNVNCPCAKCLKEWNMNIFWGQTQVYKIKKKTWARETQSQSTLRFVIHLTLMINIWWKWKHGD